MKMIKQDTRKTKNLGKLIDEICNATKYARDTDEMQAVRDAIDKREEELLAKDSELLSLRELLDTMVKDNINKRRPQYKKAEALRRRWHTAVTDEKLAKLASDAEGLADEIWGQDE